MRDIARKQGQDIHNRTRELAWLDEDIARCPPAAGSKGTACMPIERSQLPERIEAERAKVDRLRREVAVWRSESRTLGEGFTATHCTSGEAAEFEAERQRWLAERSRLEQEFDELRARCSRSNAETAAQHSSGLVASLGRLGSVRGEAARLQEELAEEKRCAAVAWEKTAEARRQLEAERRAQEVMKAQSERELTALAEECAQAERRRQVEHELDSAQVAHAAELREATEALKTLLHREQQKNAELRAALQQNQATFSRLR